jgi:Amt family ammonium transporter
VGIWGLLAVCLSNPDSSLLSQIIGILAILLWVFLTSLGIWFVLKASVGVRVPEEEEYEGVDIGECGLEAYPEFTKAPE